ncbi:MAG: hypothetical protein BroJett003_20120 [Planctomycetota bacterium]|nr:MAG: hypothetical protein BroJett003_20120 [Planctomycetota bacterium]
MTQGPAIKASDRPGPISMPPMRARWIDSDIRRRSDGFDPRKCPAVYVGGDAPTTGRRFRPHTRTRRALLA